MEEVLNKIPIRDDEITFLKEIFGKYKKFEFIPYNDQKSIFATETEDRLFIFFIIINYFM